MDVRYEYREPYWGEVDAFNLFPSSINVGYDDAFDVDVHICVQISYKHFRTTSKTTPKHMASLISQLESS